MIVRTTDQHVTKDESGNGDFQRIIGHYHKCLAEAFFRGDHYASDLDGLEGFTNDYLPNPYKTYEEAYNGSNAMLDADDYVNNSEFVEVVDD